MLVGEISPVCGDKCFPSIRSGAYSGREGVPVFMDCESCICGEEAILPRLGRTATDVHSIALLITVVRRHQSEAGSAGWGWQKKAEDKKQLLRQMHGLHGSREKMSKESSRRLHQDTKSEPLHDGHQAAMSRMTKLRFQGLLYPRPKLKRRHAMRTLAITQNPKPTLKRASLRTQAAAVTLNPQLVVSPKPPTR